MSSLLRPVVSVLAIAATLLLAGCGSDSGASNKRDQHAASTAKPSAKQSVLGSLRDCVQAGINNDPSVTEVSLETTITAQIKYAKAANDLGSNAPPEVVRAAVERGGWLIAKYDSPESNDATVPTVEILDLGSPAKAKQAAQTVKTTLNDDNEVAWTGYTLVRGRLVIVYDNTYDEETATHDGPFDEVKSCLPRVGVNGQLPAPKPTSY